MRRVETRIYALVDVSLNANWRRRLQALVGSPGISLLKARKQVYRVVK